MEPDIGTYQCTGIGYIKKWTDKKMDQNENDDPRETRRRQDSCVKKKQTTMLPSSDSRRLQQRILPSHSNSRSKSQARFHVDAVVKSPSNPLSKSSEQPFDGQPTRGRFKAFFARFRIRNLFFFIIGCASVLLIGWVNISAHDVIPKSSELGQHPAKTTGKTIGVDNLFFCLGVSQLV
jgi:hypothetical protein